MGENPYQAPADLFACESSDPLALPAFSQVSGEPPCFTNAADLDSLLHTMCLASEAFRRLRGAVPRICVAGKHGNACGMAASWESAEDAVRGAFTGNPGALWGGEVVVDFPVTGVLAEILLRSEERAARWGSPYWMLDVVAAPAFEEDAVAVLGRRERRKLLLNEALADPALPDETWTYRTVRGGFLRQPPPNYVLDLSGAEMDGAGLSTPEEETAIIAWAVAFSSSHGGNEVSLARDYRLLSAAGGPSTVEAVHTAIERARSSDHEVADSVFAADAFFPFEDGPRALVDAGVSAGVVPGGGKRQEIVRALFRGHGVTVCYLPVEYRGFARH